MEGLRFFEFAMNLSSIILVITTTLTGLMAGLFYSWSVSVMLGFRRLNDREFVSAMQKANRAIQNPVFFAAFFGAPVFLIISSIVFYGESSRFMFILASSVIYLTGNFGVTVFGNVPLNNLLENFNSETASDEEVKTQRTNFEDRWNFLNHIRAVSSTISLILLAIACLK